MTPHYKDTFRGTARYYARYREGYPAAFFTMLKEKFDLTASDRVLDLGCGTGQIAIPLSRHIGETVAMDPEPEMTAEGKEQATAQASGNITWMEGGSEDLPVLRDRLGMFKLVTIGTAFHWMDREKTLDELYRMVTPGGGIVIAWNTSIWTETEDGWQPVVRQVIKNFLGEERRAGSGTFNVAPVRHEVFVADSSFVNMETWKHHWTRESTLDEVVGNLYSTSMTNPYILAEKKDAFEKDLRQELSKACSSGIFRSEGDMAAILAWK